MATPRETVGVIGLGIMGGAIARHLAAAGMDVVGFDLSPGRRAAAETDGVRPLDDVGAVARAAGIILTSLPSPTAALDVARGIAASGAPARIVAELSTLALDDKTAFQAILAEAGHTALDCPISGTGAQAAAKDIVIYASGDADAVQRALPVLSACAKSAHAVGPYGAGSKMKFVANLLVAIHNVAAAEAISVSREAGLDLKQVIDLISIGAGGSRIFELRAPMMADQRFEPPTMKLEVWMKDMEVIDGFVRGLGCCTPLFDATQPLYDQAVQAGRGGEDTAAVITALVPPQPD